MAATAVLVEREAILSELELKIQLLSEGARRTDDLQKRLNAKTMEL